MRFVHFASVLMAGALIVAALPAEAQSRHIRRNNWRQHNRGSGIYKGTPQRFALELRGGPYYYQLDDEPGLKKDVFKDTFKDPWFFYLGAEFDWQAVRIPWVGTLGPGVGIGHVSLSGDAFAAGTYGTANPERKGETSWTILPMHVSAVLRFDELFRRTQIPIVPYAKIGLGYGMWWCTTGSNDCKFTKADGSSVIGKGASYGVHWALGGALALDFLGRREMSALDQETGVNHIYIFGEWYNQNLGIFGTGQSYVGTSTWTTGLTFEM